MNETPLVVAASGDGGLDLYRAALREQPIPVRLDCARPEAFSCTLSALRVGDLDVGDVSSTTGSPTRARRTERDIRASDPEAYRLLLNARGHARFEQDGRCAQLAPGTMALFDSSQPFTAVRDAPHRYVMVTFPRSLLTLPARRVAGATCTAWPEQAPLVKAVVSLMHAFTGRRPVDPQTAPGLSRAFVELVTAALVQEFSLDHTAPGGSPHALWSMMTSFIDDNLGDPELGAPLLAQVHHVSLRTVQRLFADAGTTVSEHIRKQRLDRCRRDLASPALRAVPIYAIALRQGFTSAPHFTRAFTERYGASPQHFRRTAL